MLRGFGAIQSGINCDRLDKEYHNVILDKMRANVF